MNRHQAPDAACAIGIDHALARDREALKCRTEPGPVARAIDAQHGGHLVARLMADPAEGQGIRAWVEPGYIAYDRPPARVADTDRAFMSPSDRKLFRSFSNLVGLIIRHDDQIAA